MSIIMTEIKDLTLQPPRSPRERIHGYVILGRAIDKCLATQTGTIGDYHFDCPLDKQIFGFKEIAAEDFHNAVTEASSEEEIANWIDQNGARRSSEEVKSWSDGMEGYYPYEDPDKKEWFEGECSKLCLDPVKTSLFDYLEADDAILRNQAVDH